MRSPWSRQTCTSSRHSHCAGRSHGIATVIVDTPDLTRDPAGLAPLLSVATDVLLTVTASAIDAAKVHPLTGTLFRTRGRLEQARAFKTQVLLNQVRGTTTHIPDLLDPERQLVLPFAPTIPARESYAQAFGEHPDQMVDGPFHAMAATLLDSWAGVVTPRDPRPEAARTLRRAVIAPGTRKLTRADA